MKRGRVSALVALAGGLALALPAPRPQAASRAIVVPADTTVPSSAWLALLPDGETKRRFILDCAGCHVFDAQIVRAQGRPRTAPEWEEAIRRMLSFAGAEADFPIISPAHEPGATAAWLARHLEERTPEPVTAAEPTSGWTVLEYPLPEPDLPHDLAIAQDGRIVATGMLTHVLHVLDPATGVFIEIPIPLPDANPRAIEVGPDGAWWVVLGAPGRLARYDPTRAEWRDWEVGLYAHEAAIDSGGRVWYNGHFTKSPEILGFLDPVTGRTRTFEVPSPLPADGGSTIPYGLRAARDGTIWMTELLGNRLVRFDPATETFTLYDLPTPHSGPRRLDVDANGDIWIPEFANDRLARFSSEVETFTEYPLPTKDALPYVARVDGRTGAVWVGTAAGDLVVLFDPAAERFDEIPLPTRSALIRHLAIDPRTGDVWGAYSPFPVASPKVFVIRSR